MPGGLLLPGLAPGALHELRSLGAFKYPASEASLSLQIRNNRATIFSELFISVGGVANLAVLYSKSEM
jgi:hypothetical protein